MGPLIDLIQNLTEAFFYDHDFAESKGDRLKWLHVRHKNSISCHTAGRVSYQISKQPREPTLRRARRHIVDISQRERATTTETKPLRPLHHLITHPAQAIFSGRDETSSMSRNSFVFTPTALRSLERDQDILERHKYRKQLASHHLTSYMLRKEARDQAPPRSSPALAAAVCQDLVVQNAVYTGDLEAMQRFFPRGSTANLVIEPQGGDMRWIATGEGRRQPVFSLGIHRGICVLWQNCQKFHPMLYLPSSQMQLLHLCVRHYKKTQACAIYRNRARGSI